MAWTLLFSLFQERNSRNGSCKGTALPFLELLPKALCLAVGEPRVHFDVVGGERPDLGHDLGAAHENDGLPGTRLFNQTIKFGLGLMKRGCNHEIKVP